MGLVAHKGEMPYPLWHDKDHRAGRWRPEEEGWLDPNLRLANQNWEAWGHDTTHRGAIRTRLHSPKLLWDWTEEELREEERLGLERLMETPPVKLSQIGKSHGRFGKPALKKIASGGW